MGDPGGTEAEVLPDAAAWTPPSWDEVVRTHSARVYRLAYRLTGNDDPQNRKSDDDKRRPSSDSVVARQPSTPRYRAHLDGGKPLQLVVNLGDPSRHTARCHVGLTDKGVIGIGIHVVQQ